MKTIIMGYGRIGSQVGKLLTEQKHDVTIIDHDADADGRLGPNFKGRIIRGLGFDHNCSDPGRHRRGRGICRSQSFR